MCEILLCKTLELIVGRNRLVAAAAFGDLEALEQLLLQKDVLASLTSPAPAEMRALCQDIFSFPWHQDASIA